MPEGPSFAAKRARYLVPYGRRTEQGGDLANEKGIVGAAAGKHQLMDFCFGQDEAVEASTMRAL